MSGALSDRVTARALALALRPGWDVDRAAADLAAIGTPLSLRHALHRIGRVLEVRPSPVGASAAQSLALALVLRAGAGAGAGAAALDRRVVA